MWWVLGPLGCGRCRPRSDDEELLTRSDHPELSSGQILEEPRFGGQGLDVSMESAVFGAQLVDRVAQLCVLSVRTKHRDEPTLADDGVRHKQEGDQHQHIPPAASRRWRASRQRG